MPELAAAAAFFLLTHLGIAGTPLRAALVARTGEPVYLLAYSALSLVAIAWLADAYKAAPYLATWGQLYVLKPVALALMALAVGLAVLGLTTPSPTLVGAGALARRPEAVRGILRITRHPFLSGVALWAITHLVVNGDLAALLLFGSLLLLAVIGAYSIDQKRAARLGPDWAAFARQTSIIPFLAVAQGRNRLAVGELGWWRLLLAAAVYAGLLHFHAGLFGVSPLPV